MATAPAPFPTCPSVTSPPLFCFGAPPYAPYPFPYPNQPPPPSPSYHAAAYHHHHSFQLPPPSHPNPHWHQGMQQMQPPPPAPGNPWHPHHAAAQAPPPSSPPPRRPSPSSPPPLAASMAAVAPAWPFPSASVPAVQEGAAPSTSSSGRLPDSPGTTSAPAAALIVLCPGPGPERRPSSPSSAPVLAPSATQARRPTPPTTNTPSASDEFSKLRDRLSSLTNSMVPSSTSSTTTAGSTTTRTSPPRHELLENSCVSNLNDAELLAAAQAQAQAEEEIAGRLPREVLNINRRLVQQQASVKALQGTLSTITDMVAQIGLVVNRAHATPTSASDPNLRPITEGATPTSFPAPNPTHQLPQPQFPPSTQNHVYSNDFGSPMDSSTWMWYQNKFRPEAVSASTVAEHGAHELFDQSQVPGYAHQVFAEMTTPSSWHETQGSAPDCRFGHHTPIQSTCLLDGNNNLSEQNLDGRPQQCGFHNLNRQSMFLADGSERSYSALPENYPLKRATLEPVFDVYGDETEDCSIAFVDVFAGTPGQQIYNEDQHESEQLAKCFGMASREQVQVLKPLFEPELNIGCSLNLNNGNYTIEFLVAASSLPFQQEQLQQVHTQDYSLMLTPKGIQEWEPGIETPSSICLCRQGLTARIETENHLSWLPVPELAKWQGQMASASFIWDPGTILLLYKSKWWLRYTEQKTNWHKDNKFYQVTLWLIHFLPP